MNSIGEINRIIKFKSDFLIEINKNRKDFLTKDVIKQTKREIKELEQLKLEVIQNEEI